MTLTGTFFEHFSNIKDPRIHKHNFRHNIFDVEHSTRYFLTSLNYENIDMFMEAVSDILERVGITAASIARFKQEASLNEVVPQKNKINT